MRYLDSSIMLAEVLAEGRRPGADFWSGPLVSSRLLTIEVWTRLQAYGVRQSHGDAARKLLDGVNIVEMDLRVVARAHEPFPKPVRALDAIHLSAADFLRGQGQEIELATYDSRMREIATAMGFELYPLD